MMGNSTALVRNTSAEKASVTQLYRKLMHLRLNHMVALYSLDHADCTFLQIYITQKPALQYIHSMLVVLILANLCNYIQKLLQNKRNEFSSD